MCYEKIFHMLQYFADFHYNGNARPLKTYIISMQTLILCKELVHVYSLINVHMYMYILLSKAIVI